VTRERVNFKNDPAPRIDPRIDRQTTHTRPTDRRDFKMTWLNDVKEKRLEEDRRVLARNQAREEALRPLSPAVSEMVIKLLEDVGDAYWGTGKYGVIDHHTFWEVRNPPVGTGHLYWQVAYRAVGDRVEKRFLGFRYKVRIRRPIFEVCYKGDEDEREKSRTIDLSSNELKRVLRHAVTRGPREISDYY
jgi:hypothetical protein